MGDLGLLRPRIRSGSQDRGVTGTTARLRQLVDGLEEAVAGADGVAASRYLSPQLAARLMEEAAVLRAAGGSWAPARSGLRWSTSRRHPDGPGLTWLTLRFEDLSRCDYPEGPLGAPLQTHELEVELDTRRVPWRICRVLERAD